MVVVVVRRRRGRRLVVRLMVTLYRVTFRYAFSGRSWSELLYPSLAMVMTMVMMIVTMMTQMVVMIVKMMMMVIMMMMTTTTMMMEPVSCLPNLHHRVAVRN